MDRSEALIENLRICNEEITMWNTLPDISNLIWKRIPTQAKNVNDHEHTGLSADKTYLVYDTKKWLIGKFTRDMPYKGWGFKSPQVQTIYLARCIMIYEFSGLPEIPEELIPRVKADKEEEHDHYCERCGC